MLEVQIVGNDFEAKRTFNDIARPDEIVIHVTIATAVPPAAPLPVYAVLIVRPRPVPTDK
jgi:hypothetical protein